MPQANTELSHSLRFSSGCPGLSRPPGLNRNVGRGARSEGVENTSRAVSLLSPEGIRASRHWEGIWDREGYEEWKEARTGQNDYLKTDLQLWPEFTVLSTVFSSSGHVSAITVFVRMVVISLSVNPSPNDQKSSSLPWWSVCALPF